MRQFYISCLVLFLLAGCGKRQSLNHAQLAQRKLPVLAQFEVEIDGVECALCAQDVTDIFKHINGVSMVDFVTSGTDYEGGHFHFCYDMRKNNLDLKMLDEIISKEGFELNSIKGYFSVRLFQEQGQQFIEYTDDLVLPMTLSPSSNVESIINQRENEAQFVQGKILRQSDSTFSFIMERPVFIR